MLEAPGKHKTMIFTAFFACGSKHHGICNVFWPGPSKNTGIYVVFSMLQEDFFSCQKQKIIVNYSIFALGKHKKKVEHRQKVFKMDLRNASWNFSMFFRDPK